MLGYFVGGFFIGTYLGRRKPKPKPKGKSKTKPKAPPVPPLTDDQAYCYLERHPDLQEAFGDNIEDAKRHWINHGHAEKRSFECLPQDEDEYE